MNKKQKAQVPTLSRADKRVCKSYIDQSYIQKIERTQRRFDSKSFIEYVKNCGDHKLQLLVNGYYKQLQTLELKPFNDNLEKIKKGVKTNA